VIMRLLQRVLGSVQYSLLLSTVNEIQKYLTIVLTFLQHHAYDSTKLKVVLENTSLHFAFSPQSTSNFKCKNVLCVNNPLIYFENSECSKTSQQLRVFFSVAQHNTTYDCFEVFFLQKLLQIKCSKL